ncbi:MULTISPECIES: YfhE family protein [Bacillaceae]|uniref:YfhE family protein n=1 Tax=Bacillaceae TaxID=186817 RepID=UPI000368FD79|nr:MULTISPECIES: YfhE family protein [Bacillaceae]
MDEKKAPKDRMTGNNNKLTDTQEVLYNHEFKKADAARKDKSKGINGKNQL